MNKEQLSSLLAERKRLSNSLSMLAWLVIIVVAALIWAVAAQTRFAGEMFAGTLALIWTLVLLYAKRIHEAIEKISAISEDPEVQCFDRGQHCELDPRRPKG